MINDELRDITLPDNLSERVWGFDKGGIETVIPFHYPALLSCYTESVLLSPARQPALTKLRVSGR